MHIQYILATMTKVLFSVEIKINIVSNYNFKNIFGNFVNELLFELLNIIRNIRYKLNKERRIITILCHKK